MIISIRSFWRVIKMTTNGRKMVLTSVRLRKKFKELSAEGYKLRQEIITCDVDNHLSSGDINILKDLQVDSSYLHYPIRTIEEYFYSSKSAVRVVIETSKDGIARMLCKGIEPYDKLLESTEDYSVFVGEDVPEFIDDGEKLTSFNLCGEEPVFKKLLENSSLLMDNLVLWSIFSNYDYKSNSKDFTNGTLIGLERSFASEISVILLHEGFYRVSSDEDGYENGIVSYKSENGDSVVDVSVTDSISLWYKDMFMSEKVYGEEVCGYKYRVQDDGNYKGDFANHTLSNWKYRSIMLNNNVNEALFKFDDIDLDSVLDGLKEDGYMLRSLGFSSVRSIVDSVTICGFKNVNGYSYIIFYYGLIEEVFMMEILSTKNELRSIVVNDKDIRLVNINLDSHEDASTLIHGFDFSNFEEYELV